MRGSQFRVRAACDVELRGVCAHATGTLSSPITPSVGMHSHEDSEGLSAVWRGVSMWAAALRSSRNDEEPVFSTWTWMVKSRHIASVIFYKTSDTHSLAESTLCV